MTRLRIKAEEVVSKCKETMNMYVKQEIGCLEDLAYLDDETLASIKSANELMEASYEYALEHAEATDAICDKLDRLQEQMMEMNGKLLLLIEKSER